MGYWLKRNVPSMFECTNVMPFSRKDNGKIRYWQM